MLAIDPQSEPSIVLDLSVASTLLEGDPSANTEPLLTSRVNAAMRAANVRLAIGRYDEPRLIYVAPAFETGNGPSGEHRTIHIGLDLFAPVGTPVFAPLDGTVHARADNRAPQDYGPVLVLRHETDDGDGVLHALRSSQPQVARRSRDRPHGEGRREDRDARRPRR